MTNRAELRRLAEAAPENIDEDWLGVKRAELHNAIKPSTILALLDVLDAKENALLAITTRHFAESWSRRSTDAKLDEYLSAGIAQLQEERDENEGAMKVWRRRAEQAEAELEAIKSSGWRNHSVNYARAEKCPQTLEAAQAAWDRDQELIEEQRQQIAKDSQTINDLRQKLEACRKDAIDLQAAKLLLEQCNEVIEEDGGVYIELRCFLSGEMPASDVIALLGKGNRNA